MPIDILNSVTAWDEANIVILNDIIAKLARDALVEGDVDVDETSEVSYTKTFSRNMTSESGDVEYSGIPFVPKGVLIITSLGASTSIGMVSSASGVGANEITTNIWGTSNPAADTHWASTTTKCIEYHSGAFTVQRASLKSFDTSGITLTWVKEGSPTGTLTIAITYFK